MPADTLPASTRSALAEGELAVFDSLLADLNEQQRAAAAHGDEPLLIVAGAGTGKTTTLAHRVAHLVARGVDPSRILLLTFTRRAARSMLDRVRQLLVGRAGSSGRTGDVRRLWSGTFHGVAARLLRQYGRSVELSSAFTICDASDAADLMQILREELGLAKKGKRFPLKGTCATVYGRTVNSQRPLKEVIEDQFPWLEEHTDALKQLFQGYTQRKREQQMLDYDDLLLFWRALMQSDAAEKVRRKFDHVLVDEYQDTNLIQADILHGLRPDGLGLCAVGDDAQSIYSFRAATVRNILDFPQQFPGTRVLPLERNYRSTQPILDLSNAVIAGAAERHEKTLWTDRPEGPAPRLTGCEDEDEQADYLVDAVLSLREEGISLKRQAILFRASHFSLALELALTRQDVPFVKYGGLRFAEAAHIKDTLGFLRLAENPRDAVAGTRVLTLMPGIGPARAARLLDGLGEASGDFAAWLEVNPPTQAADHWPLFVALMRMLRKSEGRTGLPAELSAVRKFYEPLLWMKHDKPQERLADLKQLEGLAGRYSSRRDFLTDLTLDPPTSSVDAGEPPREDDYLTLSTIHSAKGLEWDAVWVMHACDGCLPSDRSFDSAEQLEEERRLMYVALTRAKTWLEITFPRQIGKPGMTYGTMALGQPSRFLDGFTDSLLLESEEVTQVDSGGVWDSLIGQWD